MWEAWPDFVEAIYSRFDHRAQAENDRILFLTQTLAETDNVLDYLSAMRHLEENLDERLQSPWVIIARGLSGDYQKRIRPESITSSLTRKGARRLPAGGAGQSFQVRATLHSRGHATAEDTERDTSQFFPTWPAGKPGSPHDSR